MRLRLLGCKQVRGNASTGNLRGHFAGVWTVRATDQEANSARFVPMSVWYPLRDQRQTNPARDWRDVQNGLSHVQADSHVMSEDVSLEGSSVECDEAYIGGRAKNKHLGKRGGSGRPKADNKTPGGNLCVRRHPHKHDLRFLEPSKEGNRWCVSLCEREASTDVLRRILVSLQSPLL